jgi:cytochrome P450
MAVTSAELDALLTDRAFTQDPYPTYRLLREHEPVHWSDAWGVWVLTRYDDTLAVLNDYRTYSNAGRFSALLDQLPAEVQGEVQPLRRHYSSGLIQSDPPDHTRLRGLVRMAFTPRAVEAYRPTVEAVVDDLLTQARSKGSFDLVADVAYPLPAYVIMRILGAPNEDIGWLYGVTRGLADLQATGGADVEHARRAVRAVDEIEAFFRDVLDDHRRHPREDLMTALMDAHDGGGRLSTEELITTCVTLALAGHDTTKNLIANGTLAIVRNPAELERLRREPALIGPAVEECLRYDSPIQRGWRRVAADTTLHGTSLREGQLVYYMFGSANRDPERFDDPDRFDIGRPENRHLAFGYSIHFCVGAPLARLEGAVALRAIAELPGLRVVSDEIEWLESVHLRCPTELWMIAEG